MTTEQIPVDKMNKIDAAITELLGPLGESWTVRSVSGTTLRFESFGRDSANVVTGYRAVIGNTDGIEAAGEGATIGDSIAMAFIAVLRQVQRMSRR